MSPWDGRVRRRCQLSTCIRGAENLHQAVKSQPILLPTLQPCNIKKAGFGGLWCGQTGANGDKTRPAAHPVAPEVFRKPLLSCLDEIMPVYQHASTLKGPAGSWIAEPADRGDMTRSRPAAVLPGGGTAAEYAITVVRSDQASGD